jgi:uncharacterized membrane protein YbhN (UPF0104 family)
VDHRTIKPTHVILTLIALGAAAYVFGPLLCGDVLRRLGVWSWVELVILYFGGVLLIFVPSYRFLTKSGCHLSFSGFTAVMFASQAVNLITPLRMGFPVRVYLFQRRYDVPISTGTLLIPLEIFMGILINVCLALIFAGWMESIRSHRAINALLAISGIIGLAAFFVVRRAATGRALTPSGTSKGVVMLVESLRPALSHVACGTLVLFALLYATNTVVGAGILRVIAEGAGFEKPIQWLVGAWAAAYVTGVISLLPQGLGVRDASLAWILHTGGAASGQVIGIVFLVRLVTAGFPLVAGLLAWLGLSLFPAPNLKMVKDRAGTLP